MIIKSFKIKKGRWIIGNLNDALVSSKFDIFINSHRELKTVSRCKIDKKQNYQFKNQKLW